MGGWRVQHVQAAWVWKMGGARSDNKGAQPSEESDSPVLAPLGPLLDPLLL